MPPATPAAFLSTPDPRSQSLADTGPGRTHVRMGPSSDAATPSHPLPSKTPSAPLRSQILDRFRKHAAVRPCAGKRNPRHNTITHIFFEEAQKKGPHTEKENIGLLKPRPDSTASHTEPAPTTLLTSSSLTGAIRLQRPGTSQSPPVSAQSPHTPVTPKLADDEAHNEKFHNTAARRHDKSVRVTPVVFKAHGKTVVTWIAKRITSHYITIEINLDMAQRISSSRDSARTILRRTRLAATRDAPPSLSSDDWWFAWDNPEDLADWTTQTSVVPGPHVWPPPQAPRRGTSIPIDLTPHTYDLLSPPSALSFAASGARSSSKPFEPPSHEHPGLLSLAHKAPSSANLHQTVTYKVLDLFVHRAVGELLRKIPEPGRGRQAVLGSRTCHISLLLVRPARWVGRVRAWMETSCDEQLYECGLSICAVNVRRQVTNLGNWHSCSARRSSPAVRGQPRPQCSCTCVASTLPATRGPARNVRSVDSPMCFTNTSKWHACDKADIILRRPLTVAQGRALTRWSCCETWMHLAMDRAASNCPTTHASSRCERRTLEPARCLPISTTVTLFPCSSFARHDATLERDCCRCASLSSVVTETPLWFAFATEPREITANRCRSGADDQPWTSLIRLKSPLDLFSRARRTAFLLRSRFPRFRSALDACTPSSANRTCNLAHTETELLGTLDFFGSLGTYHFAAAGPNAEDEPDGSDTTWCVPAHPLHVTLETQLRHHWRQDDLHPSAPDLCFCVRLEFGCSPALMRARPLLCAWWALQCASSGADALSNKLWWAWRQATSGATGIVHSFTRPFAFRAVREFCCWSSETSDTVAFNHEWLFGSLCWTRSEWHCAKAFSVSVDVSNCRW